MVGLRCVVEEKRVGWLLPLKLGTFMMHSLHQGLYSSIHSWFPYMARRKKSLTALDTNEWVLGAHRWILGEFSHLALQSYSTCSKLLAEQSN